MQHNNKFDSSLEIMELGKHSTVEQSPKKLNLDDTNEDSCEVVHLDDFDFVKVNQFVTVVGKAITVNPLEEVRSKRGKPLSKQDCTCYSGLWSNV